MSKDSRNFKALSRIAVIGGAVATLGAGGLVLVSQAQEKSGQEAVTAAKLVTPVSPVAYSQIKADAVSGKDAADQAPVAARPVTKVAAKPFRGDTVKGQPIMLRKPMAPARVQWAQAMNQKTQGDKRQKSARVQSVASRLDQKALNATRLPVILPRAGGAIDTAKSKMVSFGDAYALNMPQDKGIQITMYGNRTFVPTDNGMISKRPMMRLAGVAEDIRISQMEDGWTATFTRFGVVYSLDVTCDDINSDDCKTDGFIRSAIAQFDDVTMGTEAQAEAKSEGVTDPASGNWIDRISNTITNLTKGG